MAVEKKLMSKKKPAFPVNEMLNAYLRNYERSIKISIYYDDLLRFQGSVTVYDKNDELILEYTLINDRKYNDTPNILFKLGRFYYLSSEQVLYAFKYFANS